MPLFNRKGSLLNLLLQDDEELQQSPLGSPLLARHGSMRHKRGHTMPKHGSPMVHRRLSNLSTDSSPSSPTISRRGSGNFFDFPSSRRVSGCVSPGPKTMLTRHESNPSLVTYLAQRRRSKPEFRSQLSFPPRSEAEAKPSFVERRVKFSIGCPSSDEQGNTDEEEVYSPMVSRKKQFFTPDFKHAEDDHQVGH